MRSIDVKTEYRFINGIGSSLEPVAEETAGSEYKIVGLKRHVVEIDRVNDALKEESGAGVSILSALKVANDIINGK